MRGKFMMLELAALATAVEATTLTIQNQCSESIGLYDNSASETIASGGITTRTLSSGFSGMFRNGVSAQATCEIALAKGCDKTENGCTNVLRHNCLMVLQWPSSPLPAATPGMTLVSFLRGRLVPCYVDILSRGNSSSTSTSSTTTPVPTPTSAPTTEAPISTPSTQAPATKAPVTDPITDAPTTAPVTEALTTAPVTNAPETEAPVSKPTTEAPTRAPTYTPTLATTTQAPISVPTPLRLRLKLQRRRRPRPRPRFSSSPFPQAYLGNTITFPPADNMTQQAAAATTTRAPTSADSNGQTTTTETASSSARISYNGAGGVEIEGSRAFVNFHLQRQVPPRLRDYFAMQLHMLVATFLGAAATTANAIPAQFHNRCSVAIELYNNTYTEVIDPGCSTTRYLEEGFSGMFRNGWNPQATRTQHRGTQSLPKQKATCLKQKATLLTKHVCSLQLSQPGSCSSLEDCKAVTQGTGFNVAMMIVPSSGGGTNSTETCRVLRCLHDGCDDAYQFPDQDARTHSCSAEVEFQVVFCADNAPETTSDSAEDYWVDSSSSTGSESNSNSTGGSSDTSSQSNSNSDVESQSKTTPEPSSDKEKTVSTGSEDSSGTPTVVYVAAGLAACVVALVAAAFVFKRRHAVAFWWETRNYKKHNPRSSDELGFVRPNAAVADSGVTVPPVLVGKIVPPGHALQQEENNSRLSLEASEVVRALNNVERTEDRFVIPESVRKSRTLDAYTGVCSEILPGFLYVSNFRVARDTAKLRALGITHVINSCGELKHYENGVEQREASEFNTLKLLLRDDASEDLTPFLPQVMEYIATSRQRSQEKETGKAEKVLVHCHQGVSRSCALAIAYVMLEQQLSYREASAMVRGQRAISSPNAAFICQLLEWEKDLQAMRTSGHEGAGFALGGLYRLTPHANYDPECLVLKRCYEPSAGSARQRQNMAIVRTPDGEKRLLWSQGTFVFQSPTTPTDLIIWHGSKCEIPDAVLRATELARQLLLAMESKIHAKSATTTFAYDGDTSNSAANVTGSDQLEVESTNVVSAPQLFILETIDEQGDDSWDQLANYDLEDLTPDSAFLLFSVKSQGLVEGYVWIGSSCSFTLDKVVQAAQKQIQSLSERNSSPSLILEHQNQESDEFWELFEAGY
ncbi:Protein-tyrosine phosphatase-like [Phytophthora cactorum]|nr:Protein-tyrosine phosphatase-like [Phytophthora cactorum]